MYQYLIAGTRVDVAQSRNDAMSDKSSQIVSHLGAKTVNFFRLDYWQSYGLVLEGSFDDGELDLTNSDNVKKTMQILKDGNVIQSIPLHNTDWYNPFGYNGYQGVLDKEALNALRLLSL